MKETSQVSRCYNVHTSRLVLKGNLRIGVPSPITKESAIISIKNFVDESHVNPPSQAKFLFLLFSSLFLSSLVFLDPFSTCSTRTGPQLNET
jgi:hypothetical protein